MKNAIVALVFMCLIVPGWAQTKTKNVVIVTLDGFRWRELFNGADERILLKHTRDTAILEKYCAPTYQKRRQKLMPFFWDVIASQGQLYGNRKFGNKMNITNPNFYSYSGYSEMFVGFVEPEISDNTPKNNPNQGILHAINAHPSYAGDVAVFSTWDVMSNILREDDSGIYMNTGARKAAGHNLTEHEKVLNFLTDSIQNPLGARYDNFTFQYAFEYMKRERPKVVFISLDETDEHAHAGQYVGYLSAAHRADRMIGELWTWLQTQPEYKDATTLIVATDHGRGKSARGWKHHRLLFRGSSQVWLAILGPDTPATGEVKEPMAIKQTQLARTIGGFLGIPYHNVEPVGEILSSAFATPPLYPETEATASGAGN